MTRTLNFGHLKSTIALIAVLLATVTMASAQNLIVNPDFEQTSGFDYQAISDYTRAWSGGVSEGYFIHDNTSTGHGIGSVGWNSGLTGYGGSGYYLLFNGFGGSTNPTKAAWKQTIAVTTNTTYTFSAQVMNLTRVVMGYAPNPSRMNLKINGVLLGDYYELPQNNEWHELTKTWNSGSATQAVIEIVDVYTGSSSLGDDFGIDHLSFIPNVLYDVQAQDDYVSGTLCPNDHVDVDVLQNDNVLPNTNDAQVQVVTNPVPHGTAQVLSNKKIRYTFTDANYNGEVQFVYRVTNHGVVSEATVHINTARPPTITVNMNGIDPICAGSSFNLPTPTVQSNGSSVSGQGWQILLNGNWQTLNNNNIPYSYNGCSIRYFATNSCGTGYSTVASVTVTDQPTITVNLNGITAICAGDSFNLPTPTIQSNGSTVTAQGWQIYLNGSWQTLNNNNIPYSYNGCTIRYFATNDCGTTYSSTVQVTVNDQPSVGTITAPAAICAGESFNLITPTIQNHGSTITSQEWEIQINGTWQTLNNNNIPYAYNGCTIRYMATNGCGPAYSNTVQVTVYSTDPTYEEISACDTFIWNGITCDHTGDYQAQVQNANGCTITAHLHFILSDAYTETQTVTECESYTWPLNGQTYYASCIDTYTIESGDPFICDSIFTLNLTIHYGDTITLEAVDACDSYEWHGQIYTTSGIKEYMTTNPYGCSRLERLPLTIHESEHIDLQGITICDSYVWHGQTYTQSGVATFDTVNQYGCNVQYSLPLTINHSDTLDWEPVTECDSYIWYGQTITESGQYTHWSTNPEGCDRLERIYITINYSIIDTLAPVTACDSYEWHGMEYTQSGYYSYEGEGPTGCPYTEVMLLTVNYSSEYNFYVTSCESYTWYDSTYTEPGTYYHILTSSQNCDSLLIMHLEMGEEFVLEESAVGCGSYEWHGNVYTESGDYPYEVENPSGCDSLFILHLTIASTFEEETEAESCYSYTWIDQILTESGDYQRHFLSEMGCDSLVTLHLTIKEAVHNEFEQQTCLPFTWNEVTYYEDGYYEQSFEAHNGCDSIVTMHLVFSEAMTSDFYHTACNPIQWFENFCDHDGDYNHTFQSQMGCDSIVTMHFSFSEYIVHEFDTLACEGFEWYGNSCTESGHTYSHVFQTPQGCDSLVKMHVTLNVMQMFTQFVSACDSIEMDGVMYIQPGSYYIYGDTLFNQNGCDSIIYRINLNIRNSESMGVIEGSHEVYVASNIINGIYRYDIDTTGLISQVTWTIDNPDWQVVEHQPTYCRVLVSTPGSGVLRANFQTASCGQMEKQFEIHAGFFGVDEHGIEVKVYPNPTKGNVTIEAEGIESIRLTNMMGQTLDWRECDRSDNLTLDLRSYVPSVYLLEIKTINGLVKKRVVVCR